MHWEDCPLSHPSDGKTETWEGVVQPFTQRRLKNQHNSKGTPEPSSSQVLLLLLLDNIAPLGMGNICPKTG